MKAKAAAQEAAKKPMQTEKLENAFMRKLKEKSEDGILDEKSEGKIKSGFGVLMKTVTDTVDI